MIVKHRSEKKMQARSEFAEGLQIFREPSTVTLMPLDKTFGLAFEVLAIKPVTLRAVGGDEFVGRGKELTFTGRALIVPTADGFHVEGGCVESSATEPVNNTADNSGSAKTPDNEKGSEGDATK